MTKILNIFIVLGMIGLLSACSSTFRSDVTRFHELPQSQGESVTIVPTDPAKANSLEFASYANIVGGYLAQKGYVPAGDGKADLIVALDYTVDEGNMVVRDYGPRFSFGYGYGAYRYHPYWYHPYWRHGFYRSSYYWGYHDPFERNMRSYVRYNRKLTMTIRPNKEGAKNLFEGEVESRGRNRNLPKLMPHMVQALFTNFPGTSGTTDRVVIELNQN